MFYKKDYQPYVRGVLTCSFVFEPLDVSRFLQAALQAKTTPMKITTKRKIKTTPIIMPNFLQKSSNLSKQEAVLFSSNVAFVAFGTGRSGNVQSNVFSI